MSRLTLPYKLFYNRQIDEHSVFQTKQTPVGDYKIDFQLKNLYFNSIYHDAKNAFYSFFLFAIVNLMLNLMRVGRQRYCGHIHYNMYIMNKRIAVIVFNLFTLFSS